MNAGGEDYNTWHLSHSIDDDIGTPWHNFVKETVAAENMNGREILEIGCGRGGFSGYLMTRFPSIRNLYACDYSESALEIGKQKNGHHDKIIWMKEDIQALSFANEMFDTVISCETIEHVPNPLKALEEIHRVLKPGGTFILTCPNYFNLFGIWCLYRKILGKPYTEGGQPFVNYILLPVIFRKLSSLGFRTVHFHSSEFVIPARVPKTFYPKGTPALLKFFGNRTFYKLEK